VARTQGLERFRTGYRESVERMFEAVGDLYAEYWNDLFHFALFPQADATWEDAFEWTHRAYEKRLRLGEARTVLELACGRGGFADFLAANTRGEVLAVDLSPAQLDAARRHRRPNLRFERHDAMEAHRLGGPFDAVVCLDAACYFPDKRLAVERIARVVAPGGRFLLVDWCRRERLSGLQEELVLIPFMEAWGIPDLETAEGHRRHFERAGLTVLEQADLNDQAAPNWEYGYRRAIEAVQELEGLATLARKRLSVRGDQLELVKDQFRAALYIKAGFDAGFLRYTLLLGERPAAGGP
jgi:SAM-dependent methyltransferase